MKQENSCFHSRLMPHVTFRSHVLFCYLPWRPFTFASFLPDAAGTAHSPTASPGWVGKRKILTRKNYKMRWNKVTVTVLVQVSDKVTVSSLKPATEVSLGLLLHCSTATRLTGRTWNYSPVLLHGQDYTVPHSTRHLSPLVLKGLSSMNLIWKTSITPNTNKVGRSLVHYSGPLQTGFISTDEHNKSLA